MNEPKIEITVMPGAQMNGYVKEQHNYFGTVQYVTKEEGRRSFLADAEDAEIVDEGTGNTGSLHEKIKACFTRELLKPEEPSRLYFLLLVMWSLKLLKSKEITSFVRMVIEAYPSIVNNERTEEQVRYAVQNMNKKATPLFFSEMLEDIKDKEAVKDYDSMIDYIDQMYPKKLDGSRRKEGEAAVTLANQLYSALK